MPEVWIPTQMLSLTGGKKQIRVPGNTIRQVVDNLEQQFPGIKARLCDEEGDLLPGIAVIVDGETSQLGLLERVQEDSEVHFLPAIGGGIEQVVHPVSGRPRFAIRARQVSPLKKAGRWGRGPGRTDSL